MFELTNTILLMDLFGNLFLLERLDHLIRTHSTGAPTQLASRLEISERHIYRIVGELCDQGLPIKYDKKKKTYYYSEPVELRVSLLINGKELLQIKGGKSEAFFFQSDIFCQDQIRLL